MYKSTTLLLVTKWQNFVTKKSWHLYRRCFLEKLAPKLAIFGGKKMLESPYLDHRFFLYVAHYLERVSKQIYFYLGPIAKFSQVLLMATTITSQNGKTKAPRIESSFLVLFLFFNFGKWILLNFFELFFKILIYGDSIFF